MDSTSSEKTAQRIETVVDIVSAYVSNNPVQMSDLPGLIDKVYSTLSGLEAEAPSEPVQQEPAVSVKKSVGHDHVVCMEDGKRFKSLRRHLMTAHGLTPEEYRAKWNLRADHPVTAPSYSAERSQLAKNLGLGRKAAPPPPKARKGRAKSA